MPAWARSSPIESFGFIRSKYENRHTLLTARDEFGLGKLSKKRGLAGVLARPRFGASSKA